MRVQQPRARSGTGMAPPGDSSNMVAVERSTSTMAAAVVIVLAAPLRARRGHRRQTSSARSLALGSLGRLVQAAEKRSPLSPRSGNGCLELAARGERHVPSQGLLRATLWPRGAGAEGRRHLSVPWGSHDQSGAEAGREELGVPVAAVAMAVARMISPRLRLMRAWPFQHPLHQMLLLLLPPPFLLLLLRRGKELELVQ